MSELLPTGPLDIARELDLEAQELDFAIDYYGSEYLRQEHDLEQRVMDLDRRHPFMNREVRVYGKALTFSLDDEADMEPLALPEDVELSPVEGTYLGYGVRQTYIPAADINTDMLVHIVRTGTDATVDAFYNTVTTSYLSHICVHGAEVVPLRPTDAHSLYDLRGDRITRQIDELAFAENDPLMRSRQVIDFASKVIARVEEQYELNHQRVSYLNSLDILDDIAVVTNDLAVAEREDYISAGKVAFSQLDNEVILHPHELDLLPSYMRLPGQEFLLGGKPELCAIAENFDGRTLIIPLDKIKSLEPLDALLKA